MNRLARSLAASFLALSCLAAQAQAPAALDVVPGQGLQPLEIAARSYMLVDITANQVLAGKDVDTPVEPASLTKLMTAYLVFDAIKSRKLGLTQRLPVSDRALPGIAAVDRIPCQTPFFTLHYPRIDTGHRLTRSAALCQMLPLAQHRTLAQDCGDMGRANQLPVVGDLPDTALGQAAGNGDRADLLRP